MDSVRHPILLLKGSFKGMHLTTDQLESLGRDLCRTLLIYTDLHIPPELQNLDIF